MGKNDRIIDGKLVLEWQSGQQGALIKLVQLWHRTFCDKAYWLVKDADLAKDIAQDSWNTIINNIDKLKDPYSFGSWASQIVYTKSIDALKAMNKFQTMQDQLRQQMDNDEKDGSDSSDNDNIKQHILDAVYRLPHRQQQVIRLFYVQEYSLKDISTILDISVGTAKSRLYHAREKLKQLIKFRNYEA